MQDPHGAVAMSGFEALCMVYLEGHSKIFKRKRNQSKKKYYGTDNTVRASTFFSMAPITRHLQH